MKEQNYYELGVSEDIWIHSSILKYICPSDGGRLAYLLHYYETKDEDEEKEHHRTGHLLHSYMEDPENFQIEDIPEVTPMSADWAIDVKKRMDEGDQRPPDEIAVNSKEELGIHSGVKDPAKIKEKFRKTCGDYLEYLRRTESTEKIVISSSQKEFIEGAIKNLTEGRHAPAISSWLNTGYDEEEFKEMEIKFKLSTSGVNGYRLVFNCKAKIDKFIVNTNLKTIRIIDYKTDKGRATTYDGYSINSRRGIYINPGSMGFYKVPRQLAFYGRAVRSYLQELGEDPETYTFLYCVIVFEKNPPYLVVPFTIGNDTITDDQVDITEGLRLLGEELLMEAGSKTSCRGVKITKE